MTGPVARLLRRARSFSPGAVRIVVVPVGVGLLALLALPGGPIDGLDRDLYDRMQRWRALSRPESPKPYVMVEIDDPSVAALGRFPWPRSRFAALLRHTERGGARVVGLDVIFSEPADSAGDAALAEALRSAGNGVLAAVPILASPDGPSGSGALRQLPVAERVIEPIPELGRAAAGVGSISILEDEDGTMRRYSLVVRRGDAFYPSFAQLLAGIASGDEAGELTVGGDGAMLIDYGSLSPAAVERVSFLDVLGYGPEEDRRVFEDRVVVVAATFSGGVDYGPTPLGPRTPRIFAQLYATHTLLSGEPLRRMPRLMSFLLALVVVGLLSTQIPARHPVQLLGMGAALAGVLIVGTTALFWLGKVMVGSALPVLAIGALVSGYGLEEWWTTNAHLRQRNVELKETLENLRRTRSAKERMEAELNIARDIQFSMLPRDHSKLGRRDDLSLHATLKPAREVGGDFYDFFMVDEHRLCVTVADVSGKGVPAALFMAVSKAILKSHAGREASPASILTHANAELAEDNESSMFVSVWLGTLDLRSGELTYSNAGHNPPYVRTRDGELIRMDVLHGPVLAALDGMTYGEETTVLGPGDMLFLYTDGVPEAMDPEGNLYTEERMRELIRTSSPSSPRELVEVTVDDVARFQTSTFQADDLTLVAVRYEGVPDRDRVSPEGGIPEASAEPGDGQAEG